MNDDGKRSIPTDPSPEKDPMPKKDPMHEFVHGQPYPDWAEARASECPVMRTEAFGNKGFSITRYDDVERVLRDPETFSSSINARTMGEFMGELILGLDGVEHRSYRDLLSRAFRPSQLAKWDESLIRPAIGQLIDDFAAAGRADLVRDVTSRYPVHVICGIVGVPVEDSEQFAAWADEINTGPIDPERGRRASRDLVYYLRPHVEDRRANPRGDLLSDLVHAEVDGQKLSEARLYGFLKLLLPAGAETTFRAMGNCLFALLDHPDVLARVVANRELLPSVIEETLRWETSVTMVARVATQDTEVAGCPIEAHAPVSVIVGSANRDETRFDRSDEWDIDRPRIHHVAFGTGPHMCLGMHLARLELRVGLGTILDRLPNLRFDPDAARPEIEGTAFRSPNALPVLFDAS